MTVSIDSRPLMALRLETSATQDIGSTPQGRLTIFPVTGGSFEGERLRGKVLPGGGDWVTAQGDGTFTLDLRVTLETDDGDLIYMIFSGVRDDAHQVLPHGAAVRDGCAEVCLSQSSPGGRYR